MISPSQEYFGDPIEEQCLKLKRQLDELVDMTMGLEDRLANPGISPEERRNLANLKKRYSREALEMMMRIDYLEDPEDEPPEESEDDEHM